MQQRCRLYNNGLFRYPIRLEIGFIFVLPKARSIGTISSDEC